MQMRTSFTRGGQWAGGLRPHRLRCTRIKVGFGPAGGMGGGAPNQQKPDLEWDPDNVLGPTGAGHIARRETERMIKKDAKFGEALSMAQTQEQKEKMVRRQARQVPDEPGELIEFFLNTNLDDMEFEVARCRPKLTKDFYDKLDNVIGETRFQGVDVDEDRLAELETLRDYLEGASKAVDAVTKETTDAVDRFRKLVTSTDKKATILQMVADNEIDLGLINLISQNVEMAREAKETKKAEFMEKLQKACEKYMIVTEDDQTMITPMMKTAKAGDESKKGLYNPSSPAKPDPDALEILNSSSRKSGEDGEDEPKRLILHP